MIDLLTLVLLWMSSLGCGLIAGLYFAFSAFVMSALGRVDLLLKSFGLVSNAATLVSCPTCGRIEIDLIKVANEVEEYISNLQVPLKVSVLGCAVNGPGEAREADIGIAGGRGEGLLFRHGEIIRKVPEETMVEELKKEIDKMAAEYLAKNK